MIEIIPRLYLATYNQARISDLPCFVVNCTKDFPMVRHEGVRVAVDDDGNAESMQIMLAGILEVLPVMHQNITSGKNVVVHCLAGQQRSPTMVCAYLIWKGGHSLESAIRILREKRKEAFFWSINFREPLEAFATKLRNNDFP